MKKKYFCTLLIAISIFYCIIPFTTKAATLTDSQINGAIDWAYNRKNSGDTSYSGWCLKFVSDAWWSQGIGNSGYAYATLAGNAMITNTDWNPPKGAVVFWDWYGTIDGIYRNWGHVGISLGDGTVIHADYNGIRVTSINIDTSRTYRGWGGWAGNSLPNNTPDLNTWIKTDKSTYNVGETVNFSFGYKYGTSVSLGIDKDGVRYANPEVTGMTFYSRSFSEPGNYSVYVSGWSQSGYEDSDVITFSVVSGVSDSDTWIKTDKSIYAIGENVLFTFGYKYTTSVSLGIDKDGLRYANPEVTGMTSYSRSFSEPGSYSVYVSGWSQSGYEDSSRVEFLIQNPDETIKIPLTVAITTTTNSEKLSFYNIVDLNISNKFLYKDVDTTVILVYKNINGDIINIETQNLSVPKNSTTTMNSKVSTKITEINDNNLIHTVDIYLWDSTMKPLAKKEVRIFNY